MAILNKIFNERCVEQLAWQGYAAYVVQRLMDKDFTVVQHFQALPEDVRAAWIEATNRILELAIWEVEHKLSS